MVVKGWLFCLVTAAAVSDLRRRRIPNRLILVGLAACLLGTVSAFALPDGGPGQGDAPGLLLSWQRGWRQVGSSLAGGGAAFLLHWIPYLYRSMGAGDVKLALVIGLLLGWQGWWIYAAKYCWVLSGTALVLMLAGRRRPASLPLAPFMALAYYSFLLWP